MNDSHLFIINTLAGNKDYTENLVKQIENSDVSKYAEIALTDNLEESTKLIRKRAAETDGLLRVYSCGGDGTLNGVVNASYGLDNVAIGVIPTGTGNDFIKSFDNFTKNDFLNVKKMTTGEIKGADLLFVNGKICVNIATLGFDAAVSYEMNNKFRFLGGSTAYNASLIYCLVAQTKHYFKLFADGEEIKTANDEYLLTAMANGKYYGGGFKVAPYADTTDGYIDLVWIPKISRTTFLKLVGDFKKGLHINNPKIPIVGYKRCKKINIQCDTPINTNLDGEIIPMKNPEIILKHNAIKIILPNPEVC